jgi:hypothetical protein
MSQTSRLRMLVLGVESREGRQFGIVSVVCEQCFGGRSQTALSTALELQPQHLPDQVGQAALLPSGDRGQFRLLLGLEQDLCTVHTPPHPRSRERPPAPGAEGT